jgi:hypothetical protein
MSEGEDYCYICEPNAQTGSDQAGDRVRLQLCRGCGLKQPPLWMVPKRVWRHYIPEPERGALLCIECWQKIVEATDRGRYQNKYGSPKRLDLQATSRDWCKYRARAFRRFPSPRMILVGFHSKDWRLVIAALREVSSTRPADSERLLVLADIIKDELKNA